LKHRATKRYWKLYGELPLDVRRRADKAYALLQIDTQHPSLHFKSVGSFWSARIDLDYRALAYRRDNGFVWVWIGPHDEYMRLIKSG
jgi:hypothetical protein